MTPVPCMLLPVSMLVRAGTQTGHGVMAVRKSAPSRARRSRLGVCKIRFPAQDSASKRCWSVIMNRRLGWGAAPSRSPGSAAAEPMKVRRFIETGISILGSGLPSSINPTGFVRAAVSMLSIRSDSGDL